MSILNKLQKINKPSLNYFLVGANDALYSTENSDLFDQLNRLTPVALPMYWNSTTAEAKLKIWFKSLCDSCVKGGWKEIPLCLTWGPWYGYCAQLPPTDQSDATTKELALWDKWFKFWKDLIATSTVPVKLTFYNDTECYLKASVAIPTASPTDQVFWDQNLLFRFVWAENVIKQYFPNASYYWYGLGAVQREGLTKWRVCPNFPDSMTGPTCLPMYAMNDIPYATEMISRTSEAAINKKVKLSANITFSGSVDWKVGRFTTNFDWDLAKNIDMYRLINQYVNDTMFIWCAAGPIQDTVNTRDQIAVSTSMKWWNHYISYFSSPNFTFDPNLR